MPSERESPRFVLILGGLFLIAYAAYQVGSGWMEMYPPSTSAPDQVSAYQEPEPTIIPMEPYPGVEVEVMETPLQPYPGVEATNAFEEPYPDLELSNTPEQPYPEPEVTSTTEDPYPEPEISLTPTIVLPTVTPTHDAATPTLTQPTATSEIFPTSTPTDLPTATSDGSAYPGPEPTITLDPNNPYPGPEPTETLDPGNPYPGPEQTFTPTPSPTLQSNTPTLTISLPPTLESQPTPFTTLPFTETMIVAYGSVNQAIWLIGESELAMATSDGIYLYPPTEDGPRILDPCSSILSVAFLSDNDYISAGGGDSLIRQYDRSTGNFIGNISGHNLGVVRLFHSTFGGFLASASDDATVRIWENDGNPRHTLRGPITRVLDMAVSPNGRIVAAASNQHVHIWNPQNGELIQTISQPEGWYTSATFKPNSQILATAYEGQRLEFWNTETWVRDDFILVDGDIQALTYHPTRHVLAIAYKDGRLQIRDSSYDYLLADLPGHQGITSLAFNPLKDQLVTSSSDGSIRIWDLTLMFEPQN